MKFRVKDYCRIILYLPPDEKIKIPNKKQKNKRIEDDIDARLSEDDGPINAEDSTHPSPNHRPPSYNPEDYAHAINKYAHSSNIYAQDQREKKVRGKDKNGGKDSQPEMALKQFASLPELLRRLREDLKSAYLSFVKEFVRDPHDGVTLLLNLLKMIQLAQSNLSGNPSNREQQVALRRALIDEFECLSCLRCCLRSSEAPPRLSIYKNGLYVLASATMSSLTRSRTLSLQLLTKSCDGSAIGHRQVIEAFSTLRLRYSEPVRYKFLVSMMLSHPHPSFQVWSMRFLNSLVCSCETLKERAYLQEELAEAGFDISGVKKALEHRGSATQLQQEAVLAELEKWAEQYVDVDKMNDQLTSLRTTSSSFQKDLHQLRQSNSKLLEENVFLRAVGGEVEERCSALKRRLEYHGISSAPSPAPSMTDSEVSSFATVGQSTIKRNNSQRMSKRSSSPYMTIDANSALGTEGTNSPDWTMIRHKNDQCMRIMENGQGPPIPKKRQVLNCQDYTRSPERSRVKDRRAVKSSGRSKEEAARILQEAQGNINKLNNVIHKTEEHPERHLKTKEMELKGNFKTKDNNSGQNRQVSSIPLGSGEDKKMKSEPVNREKSPPIPKAKDNSPTSSTSSLTVSSSNSFNGAGRMGPAYVNVNKRGKDHPKHNPLNEEGEIEYERDVIVYEAITLGNDTIVMNSDSTNVSQNSSNSKSSDISVDSDESRLSKSTSVRQSVRNYERMTNNKTVDDNTVEETMQEGSSNYSNSINDKKTNYYSDDAKDHTDDTVSATEVEAVMNGLENVIKCAESSMDLGKVKENPLCLQENGIGSDSSEEIPPPIPPRASSRGTSSHSSRGRTPDISYQLQDNAVSEEPESDLFQHSLSLSQSNRTFETESSNSFGYIKGDGGKQNSSQLKNENSDSLANNYQLKRSESMHTSISDYNSHRSYSPRRKTQLELVPLKESEVNISGRTYTKYVPNTVDEKNILNRVISGKIKRRRNRSIDDKLDTYYDDDFTHYIHDDDPHRYSRNVNKHDSPRSNRPKNSDCRRSTPPKMRHFKQQISNRDINAFNGFRNPAAAYRDMDVGTNFVLSHPKYNRVGDILSDYMDVEHRGRFRSRSSMDIRRKVVDDPDIPTPDYSATPSGTLTHPVSGRHILDTPSGLY